MIYHGFRMDFPIKSSIYFGINGPDSRLSALHLFIAAVALAAQPQVVLGCFHWQRSSCNLGEYEL